jgi:protein SCO1/2
LICNADYVKNPVKADPDCNMKIFRFILIAIVLFILGIWLGRDYPDRFLSDNYPSATVLEVPIPIFQISLTDHTGQNFKVRRLARKWSFMFFGYTHCPDVCPMALVDLNAVYHHLLEQKALVHKKYNVDTQFIFVTVDPERDTVEKLNDYVPFFNKNFIGLTADPDMIAKLAHPLGVAYMRETGKESEEDYLVDHTASFLLIDPLGRLRATFPPPHDPVQIAGDFQKIREKYADECCLPIESRAKT